MKTIVFKQEFCTPCATLASILEHDLQVKADQVINLSKASMEELQLASKYGVMSAPVLVLADDNGESIKVLRGMPNRDAIVEVFELRG